VANGEVFTTPALSTNLVIAGSNDGSLYCLNRTTGQIVWKTQIHGSPTSPAFSGDKIVVSSDGTLSLIQLNDGKLLWSHSPSDSLTAPAVVDGKVIVGTDDGFIILYQ
jgi:outer membrane protein assembly factor BamB